MTFSLVFPMWLVYAHAAFNIALVCISVGGFVVVLRKRK